MIQIPKFMKDLDRKMCFAIELNPEDPDKKGRSLINLKEIPNGHFSIYFIRISSKITSHSRLKALGRAKNIFININRKKLNPGYINKK